MTPGHHPWRWRPGLDDSREPSGARRPGLNDSPAPPVALLAPLYARAPHFEAAQWVILDALFASGRDETAFEWLEVPAVVRLDDEALDACFRDLELRRRPQDVEALYSRLLCRGYCAFSEDKLLSALRDDGRFVVEVRLCRPAAGRAGS